METLIEQSKIAILLLMVVIAGVAIHFSIQLQKLTAPLSKKLTAQHRDDDHSLELQDPWLTRIRGRYETLISHVDTIDTAEFSAGEIETLPISLLGRQIPASSAVSLLRQAPGVLISLGLLGTFFGLTVGLSQISRILIKEASPAQALASLSAIISPMGAAFESSLSGLLLSLVVLIWSQLNGSRECLQRCELLLSSWLETVLPRQMGSKLMTPLRQSIENLNTCASSLPMSMTIAIQEAMNQAFSKKLEEIFTTNATLAIEAQSAIRQLAGISNALNESGQDFLRAAQSFQQSNFATTLQKSVESLIESRELLTASAYSLSEKLLDIRDGLAHSQSEWRLLAKTAETELKTCRSAIEQIKIETQTLRDTSKNLASATEAGTEASKQLREARLEVMRDRKLSIEVAESIRARLATDSAVVESCKTLTSSLASSLNHWNQGMEKLEKLQTELLKSSLAERKADNLYLESQKAAANTIIEQLREKLLRDLGSAIESQKNVINELKEPTLKASIASQELLQEIEKMKSSIRFFNATQPSS